jgi:hypothetical protein
VRNATRSNLNKPAHRAVLVTATGESDETGATYRWSGDHVCDGQRNSADWRWTARDRACVQRRWKMGCWLRRGSIAAVAGGGLQGVVSQSQRNGRAAFPTWSAHRGRSSPTIHPIACRASSAASGSSVASARSAAEIEPVTLTPYAFINRASCASFP